MDGWEIAARMAGWEMRGSHFTKAGVSIAYVDWQTLCQAEGIAKGDDQKHWNGDEDWDETES